ncbi:serine--tRNA ligase [Ferroacidibacillus organovorans]|uniref:Serine--tRNA ligase n=1 Tax=Ferroacidibacillus organovorans TaxID=1765683 RepID=A0A162UNT9_9BACL|nr:serine--tRNA ligase [Ferroacidibacillus organovorans]KYP81909.1 serine--tRNA ligase [Ferroacidibacillus organovorans]OAG94884.1 serine--tRNA ligase [Ferroacidibacillus organovorans]OPG15036.1 serine--tRNA ligase [Ferroacidibacillus organovorans]
MLDAKLLRQNPDRMRQALSRRRESQETIDMFEQFLDEDRKWREYVAETEQLKANRNAVTQQVAQAKRNGEDAQSLIEKMRLVGDQIQALDAQIRESEQVIEDCLLRLPNLPHDSVPEGASEEENPELRRHGEAPVFSFEPKNHWDLGQLLGILDFERAAKVSGSRFVIYKGLGARLERALMNFMIDMQAGRGYEEVWPPYLVNRASMVGTGNLPKFEDDVFRVADEDFYLIPTAEVPVTNLHRDEILALEMLPINYAGFSSSFRSEAGSSGRDTRGLIRLHQFQKVELVKFTTPESSYDALEAIVEDAEAVLRALRLPYRVIEICTGDLGFKETKKYDLEVWLPGAKMYREISSCSNFEDFQARRANIRFRRTEKSKPEFVHTLNGSALALGRTMAAILENYQEADGTIRVPEVLIPYMGGVTRMGYANERI